MPQSSTDQSKFELNQLLANPLWFYIKLNRLAFFWGLVALIVTDALDAYWPLLLKDAIDKISVRAPSDELLKISLMFFLVMASLAITRYFWRTLFGKYHTYAAEDLRRRIFSHLTDMGPSFFHKQQTGEILSLIINDVQAFRAAIGNAILILVDAVAIICIVLPMMIYLNPTWTWKTLIFLPAVPFLIKYVMQKIYVSYKDQQDKLAELSGVSQELVAGIRVIKSFAQEKNKLKYYDQFNSAYENSCNHTAKIDSMFDPVMQFGVISGSVILLVIASDDVISGAVTIGTLVAFHRYISKMIWPMSALGMGFSQYQKGMASFARIKELLNQPTDVPDHGSLELEKFESLEVRNLSFSYSGNDQLVLKDLNFKIEAGQTVGLVGPVGSGKTTLLHLLTRLYPVESGKILINGISVEKYSLKSLRKTFVFVPQEPFLFSNSIIENVCYGLPESADQNRVSQFLKDVDIINEINELPDRMNSQLGERGVNLSGGQKQRLTIARGLILDAKLLLLDDSLSAVDVNTEHKLQESLKSKSKDSTLVIVSHRLSALKKADHIIVFREGQIEAQGQPEKLLQISSTFKKMQEIQGEH